MFEKLKNDSFNLLDNDAYQSDKSMWKDYENSQSHLIKISGITSDEEMVDYLLAQFSSTKQDVLGVLKPQLLQWLIEMKKNNIDINQQESVRDFIYEMF